MLKVGLAGIGFMGRGHLDQYLRLMDEGFPVELVAICDVDAKKFKGEFIAGNIDVGAGKYDFDRFRQYASLDDMLKNEKLDYVDIALPTYEHAQASIKAMEAGCHALCEKPMAMNAAECQAMIDASQKTGKALMIGQCLRFWPMYLELKKAVEDKRYGEVKCAYFFRGGGAPRWSYQNWLLTKEKAGGALLDQHIHDVDTIQWLFGMPEAVTTAGVNTIPGSGYDAVSTNYHFADGKVVNAQDDWSIEGGFGFEMTYRVNFERGSMVLRPSGLEVFPHEGESFKPELSPDTGYYNEIKYFVSCIMEGKPVERCTPQSTRDTIRIADAEVRSADAGGVRVAVQ